MEEIKEYPLGNATDLLTWFNFPYNSDVKRSQLLSKISVSCSCAGKEKLPNRLRKRSVFRDSVDFNRVKALAHWQMHQPAVHKGTPMWQLEWWTVSGTDGLWMSGVIPGNDVLTLKGHEFVWKKDSLHPARKYL